jgi:hypothetical protein
MKNLHRKHKCKTREETKAQVFKLSQAFVSPKQIATRLGISKSYVCTLLSEHHGNIVTLPSSQIGYGRSKADFHPYRATAFGILTAESRAEWGVS